MPRALKTCSTVGCPELTPAGTGRCVECKRKASRARGGYETRGGGNQTSWRKARAACLRRDPLCVCTDGACPHGPQCLDQSTVADHHPDTKADLVAQGVRDVDALHRLRGLCGSCHSRHTARTTPGGWANRG